MQCPEVTGLPAVGSGRQGLPCLPHTQCHPGEGPTWSCRTYLLPPGTTVQRTSDAADKGRNIIAENTAHTQVVAWGGKVGPSDRFGFGI